MKRELTAQWQGRSGAPRDAQISIEAGAAPGLVRVTIDGQAREVDAVQVRPGTWSVIIDGRAHLVDLDKRPSDRGIAVARASAGTLDGTVTIEDAARHKLRSLARRGGAAAGSGERIEAPIAGKIVKVLVGMGDVVTAGQAVVVVEAMKMENEIVALRGGTVTQLGKAAGAAVDTGELLVQLS